MNPAQTDPLISIIIPVYRAELFLEKCVESLLAQTYQHIEIILVEDGSPDNCGELCDAFATKDSRIRVIHQANAGPSTARNRGIAAATGEFICFVDADDYADKGYISYFTDALGEEVDMVFQGMNSIHEGGVSPKIPQEKLYKPTELSEAIADINHYGMFGFVWNKLFRKSVITSHRLQFRQDISLSEDRIFALEYLLHARHMQVVAKAAYYYKPNENGLTAQQRHYKELKAAANANLEAALQLLARCPSERFLRDTRRMYVMSATWFLTALFRDNAPSEQCTRAFREFRVLARDWLPLYTPHTLNAKVLCYVLRCPAPLGALLMKIFWYLKRLKHEISA